MRKVQCAECGKRYDFDEDDFCPKCGAFNQPDSWGGSGQVHLRTAGPEEPVRAVKAAKAAREERPARRQQARQARSAGAAAPRKRTSIIWKIVMVVVIWQLISIVMRLFLYI